jgi:hypothetical protein
MEDEPNAGTVHEDRRTRVYGCVWHGETGEEKVKVIFNDIAFDDFYFAGRTARYLMEDQERKDAVIEFTGENLDGVVESKSTFHAHRTGASNISVRKCVLDWGKTAERASLAASGMAKLERKK